MPDLPHECPRCWTRPTIFDYEYAFWWRCRACGAWWWASLGHGRDEKQTLQQYLIKEYEEGKIEFVLRIASVYNGKVEIYIHPHGKDGSTTPTLIVDGDHLRTRPDDTLVSEG